MKNLFIPLISSLGVFLGFLLNGSPVHFQSLESVTESGDPVFNEIGLSAGWFKDIWLLRQSHKGAGLPMTERDRLAIVVDKSVTPYVAKFFQLAPGNFEFEEKKLIPYSARCFACHANGPRAILYNPTSSEVQPNFIQKIKIAVWNLRIKSYGQVRSEAGTQLTGGVPFKSMLSVMSTPLDFKSCILCHSEDGIRSPLRLEHLGTVNFLVKNNFMPPFPFKMSEEDSVTLNKLIKD